MVTRSRYRAWTLEMYNAILPDWNPNIGVLWRLHVRGQEHWAGAVGRDPIVLPFLPDEIQDLLVHGDFAHRGGWNEISVYNVKQFPGSGMTEPFGRMVISFPMGRSLDLSMCHGPGDHYYSGKV